MDLQLSFQAFSFPGFSHPNDAPTRIDSWWPTRLRVFCWVIFKLVGAWTWTWLTCVHLKKNTWMKLRLVPEFQNLAAISQTQSLIAGAFTLIFDGFLKWGCDENTDVKAFDWSGLLGSRATNIHFSGAIVPTQIALRARWCSWRLWSSLAPVPLWCKCHPASRLHIERRGFLILSKKASTWMMSSMETKRCLAWEHGAASFRSWGPTSTLTQRLCRTCCNLLGKILKELTWTLVWSKTWRTRRFRSRFRTSLQTRRSWQRLCKRIPWCSRWWQWIQSLQSWWKAQKLCNGFWAQRFSRKCSMVVLMKTPSRASWKRPLPQNRLVQGRRCRRATWGTRQICFPRCCHQMSLLCFLKVA